MSVERADVGHLGELEQLILFAVTALGDDAYGLSLIHI